MDYDVLGDSIIGYSTLLVAAVGLLGNTLLLSYFLCNRAWRRLSDTLYFLTCQVDVVIIVFHMPVSLSLIDQRAPSLWFRSELGCGVWGVVWNTAMRLSIFIIMILTITRMLILVYPFKRIRKLYILVLIGVYFILEFTQALIPFFFDLEYRYVEQITMCTWPESKVFTYPSNQFYIWFFYRAIFEFATPFIVIIVCCIISITSLRRSKRAAKYNPHDYVPNTKNSATITIILLACAYIVCNTPIVIYCTTNFIDSVIDPYKSVFESWDKNNYCFIVSSINSVLLNAAVNPVLFCSRVRAIRAWVRGCFLARPGPKGRESRVTAPFTLQPLTRPSTEVLENVIVTSFGQS